LQIITVLGCAVPVLALGLTAWAILARLVFAGDRAGIGLDRHSYLSGLRRTAVSIPVIGVGKIYFETKRRPHYYVAEALAPTDAASRLYHDLDLVNDPCSSSDLAARATPEGTQFRADFLVS
jgi:hypothetical protein